MISLPDWTKKVYPGGDMKWLAARSFATNTYTPKLARLKVGFLIKEMFQRFSNKSLSLSNPKQSVWIYSAHDTTVANLLNALGLFEVQPNIILTKFLFKKKIILLYFYRYTVLHTQRVFC